jgi:hypothetical protein
MGTTFGGGREKKSCTPQEALNRFMEVKRIWIVEEERVVRCLEKDLVSCLVYYDFPKEV